ncbi:MAG: VPLPA-CTERM sorting domain-containing protein [Gammaproteobacteria bacterium]|nr:VPLPA-CTERM sorting domain-containing protein [Gammaproteobacteria bacterium]
MIRFKHVHLVLPVSLFLFIISLPVSAVVVYNNGGPTIFGGHSISGSLRNEPADNFSLSTASNINSIGFYIEYSGSEPFWDQGITYNIYSDNNNEPDSLIVTGTSQSLIVKDSGQPSYSGIAYLAAFNLESTVSLDPGNYWLGLTDAVGSNAYWVLASPYEEGSSYYRSGDQSFTGREFPFDLAFYLNDELTAVPLPASVWLFGSALAGLIVFKRKKRET